MAVSEGRTLEGRRERETDLEEVGDAENKENALVNLLADCATLQEEMCKEMDEHATRASSVVWQRADLLVGHLDALLGEVPMR